MAGQPDLTGLLTIDTTGVVPVDQDGLASNLVITRSAGVKLTTNINLGGVFIGLFGGHSYTVRFFAESMGPGGNALLATVTGVFPAAPPASTPISSGVVSGASLPADGLYRLTTVTTVTGAPVTAFAPGPIIEIAF